MNVTLMNQKVGAAVTSCLENIEVPVVSGFNSFLFADSILFCQVNTHFDTVILQNPHIFTDKKYTISTKEHVYSNIITKRNRIQKFIVNFYQHLQIYKYDNIIKLKQTYNYNIIKFYCIRYL